MDVALYFLLTSIEAVMAADVIGLRSVHVHVGRIEKMGEPDDQNAYADEAAIVIPQGLARIGVRLFSEYVDAYLLIVCFVLMWLDP